MIEHQANEKDPKNYTVEGRFTHTIGTLEPSNIKYGKLYLFCDQMTVDKAEVTQIEGAFSDDNPSCFEPTLHFDDILCGWWVYSGDIACGGDIFIHLNYSPQLRPKNYYSRGRSTIRAEPN